jgi:hypothetical protein
MIEVENFSMVIEATRWISWTSLPTSYVSIGSNVILFLATTRRDKMNFRTPQIVLPLKLFSFFFLRVLFVYIQHYLNYTIQTNSILIKALQDSKTQE